MTAFQGPIRFACQGCGLCCTGEPGTVYTSPREADRIAAYLDMPLAQLLRDYLFPFRDGYSIREDHQGNCLFYARECRIYPERPAQCRCFPFWRKNLASLRAWRKVERECPGIGQGPLYSEQTIRRILEESPI